MMTPKFPPVLIGEPEALLLLVPLKIKDNVDHAGLSQLLDPLKEPPLSMEKKKLQSFSESQLVDCSSSYGNEGCNGGLMDNAFQYVQKYGITTEAAYPYKPTDGKCKTQGGAFKITGYTDVAQGDAKALAAACAKQPVSVAVDANNFQFYDNGVFSDCQD